MNRPPHVTKATIALSAFDTTSMKNQSSAMKPACRTRAKAARPMTRYAAAIKERKSRLDRMRDIILSMPLVLQARQLSKRFVLRHNAGDLKVRALGLIGGAARARREELWAVRGVSLRIDAGESLALVGRNGSGKSTFLKLVAGIHRPTSGELLVRRGVQIASMIELGTGFHAELTGQENVLLNASIHGLSRAQALAMYDGVVAYSGLQLFMDVPL